MSKRPTDHLEPSAKRRNERQLTKDDDSDQDEQPVDPGNFARASEDVLKQRKIVKARRGGGDGGDGKANPFAGIQLAATGAAPAANPFTGVSLFGAAGTPAPTPTKVEPAAAAAPVPVRAAQQAAPAAEAAQASAAAPPASGTEQQQEAKKEAAAEEAKPAATSGGFGALAGSTGGLAFGKSGFGSASGGFGSLAGTGAAFSFGAASGATTSSSIFSFSAPSSAPAFSFGASSGAAAGTDAAPAAAAGSSAAAGGTSLFGATPASGTPVFASAQAAPAKVELPGEQAVTTGEEEERTVFSGEGALFEFDASKQWRERGRGEMRVNVAPTGQARLVMRQKGNLRLLLNANLWAEMQVSKMEGGKGATFACINVAAVGEESDKKGEGEAAAAPSTALSTFALRIKMPEVLDQFMSAVNAHKAGGRKGDGEP